MAKIDLNKWKKTKYDDIELSKLASWAIWDKDDIENTEIIEENIDDLNGKIVFVALNFSRERKIWNDWQNFHCEGRGDEKLRDLLSGTIYKGAYMTDLIKYYHDANADEAKKEFKRNEEKRNKDIDFLLKEIELLETKDIEMYLFGGDLEDLFKDYIIKREDIYNKLKQKVIKCQRIHHYSPQVTDFEVIAPIQLDIPITMEQIKEKCKYKPLWGKE